MNEEAFFFDTYALFEIIKGNPKYEKYKGAAGMITIFNLAELNYGLKKEMNWEAAENITDKYAPLLVEVSVNDVREAMSLRIRKKQLSIPGVVGYVIARKHKLRFLTGDKEFEKMLNVEFVKK